MTACGVALRAAGIVVLLLLGVLAVPAEEAAAHTRTQETTNLDSRITVDPALPGVTWQVHTGGLLIEVHNDGPETLIVEGYDGEPYLRIGPSGVEHNRRSPATYLNDDRVGQRVSARTDVAMPPDVDPEAPADWVRVNDEPRAIWHDHRVHWMSSQPPPFVDAGPISRAMMQVNLVGVIGRADDEAGVFQDWRIPLTHDGEATAVEGEMAWDDPPSAWPWLLVAVVLLAPGLLGLRRGEPRDVLRPAALVLLLVAMVNGIHLVDDLIAWPSAPLDELFGVLHTATFLGTGIGASLWALKVDHGRVLALAIAAAAVLYHQGLIHLPMLQASHFPTVWPDALVRLTVALGLLQAVMVAVVLQRARRLTARTAAPSPSVASADPVTVDAR